MFWSLAGTSDRGSSPFLSAGRKPTLWTGSHWILATALALQGLHLRYYALKNYYLKYKLPRMILKIAEIFKSKILNLENCSAGAFWDLLGSFFSFVFAPRLMSAWSCGIRPGLAYSGLEGPGFEPCPLLSLVVLRKIWTRLQLSSNSEGTLEHVRHFKTFCSK